MRRALLLALVLPVALPAAPAWAATVHLEHLGTFQERDKRRSTTTVEVHRVVIAAAPGEVNHLEVGPAPDRGALVRDTATPLVAGPGCAPRPDGAVLCAAERRPEILTRLNGTAIDLGDRADRLVLRSPAFALAAPTDLVSAGPGNDIVRVVGADSHAQVAGGPGADDIDAVDGAQVRVTYAERAAPVRVTLDEAADDGEPGEGDRVGPSVTEVVGGAGPDTLVATGAAVNPSPEGLSGVTLRGGPGDDVLLGSPRDDVLDGGAGADVLRGAAGSDLADYARRTAPVTVQPGTGADDGEAGERDDVGGDVERVRGGAGNDVLRGGPGAQELDGGPGDDRLQGGPGTDRLLAADGADTADGGAGRDIVVLAGRTVLALRDRESDGLVCREPVRARAQLDLTDRLGVGCRPQLEVAVRNLRITAAGTVRAAVRCPRALLACRSSVELRARRGAARLLGRSREQLVTADGRRRHVTVVLTRAGRAVRSGTQAHLAVKDYGRTARVVRPVRLRR